MLPQVPGIGLGDLSKGAVLAVSSNETIYDSCRIAAKRLDSIVDRDEVLSVSTQNRSTEVERWLPNHSTRTWS